MRTGVVILIDSLEPAGGETVAVNIAVKLNDSEAYKPIVCATRGGGELEDLLIANEIPYLLLERRKFYQAHKFQHLTEVMKSHDIRIIHAHKTGSNFWATIIGKINNVDAIFTHVHGCVGSWTTSILERFASRASDKIIAVSESEKERLVNEGVSRAKIVTIYNGIDCQNYQTESNPGIRSRFRLKPEPPVVGIFAGLREEKNHELFLRAAREVVRENHEVYFLIVGDGPKMTELRALASDLGIARNCVFTGFIKNVAELLSVVDIGVLCSTREALPLSLLEYMASAKPIVATRVGGIPEVIREGENGLLVPSGDYNALAEKIKILVRNRILRVEMGRNGRLLLQRKFSAKAMMSSIENLYAHTCAASDRNKKRLATSQVHETQIR